MAAVVRCRARDTSRWECTPSRSSNAICRGLSKSTGPYVSGIHNCTPCLSKVGVKLFKLLAVEGALVLPDDDRVETACRVRHRGEQPCRLRPVRPGRPAGDALVEELTTIRP
ncbi:hypothetical protein Van01_54940 [Micromonospora andamanensis]|uniref:Uncharacterized protein n=1 Tax=Micromonospora andamanensis TaxID=1287068 RepID=A0ABQ4I2Z8_9ACTN|nr:hypothetical protein Van01_54940 [Micromonospora andamanensis]